MRKNENSIKKENSKIATITRTKAIKTAITERKKEGYSNISGNFNGKIN